MKIKNYLVQLLRQRIVVSNKLLNFKAKHPSTLIPKETLLNKSICENFLQQFKFFHSEIWYAKFLTNHQDMLLKLVVNCNSSALQKFNTFLKFSQQLIYERNPH